MNTPEALRALGLNRSDLNEDEVTKAYRKKIRTYHPDKNVNLSPATRERHETHAKEINNAKEYLDELLENPQRRPHRRVRESPPRASPPRESRRRTSASPPRASPPRASPPRASPPRASAHAASSAYAAHPPQQATYSYAAAYRRNQRQRAHDIETDKAIHELATEMASHYPKFHLSGSDKNWAKGSLTGQMGKSVSKEPSKSPFSFLHNKKHRTMHRASHRTRHRTMRREAHRARTRKRSRK
jgi:curved DNA-binding protein CbpA